jgi:hypothetical protein
MTDATPTTDKKPADSSNQEFRTTQPESSLDRDLFNYKPVLQSLVGRLVTQPDTNLLGLFAPWGCGKTTALNFCHEIHSNDLANFGGSAGTDKSLWLPRFETWQYENVEDLTVAMLWHIQRSLASDKVMRGKPTVTSVLSKLKNVATTVAVAGAKMGTKAFMGVDAVELAQEAFNPGGESDQSPLTMSSPYLQCELQESVATQLAQVGEELLKDGEFDMIVVPVDDMDRCSPENGVRLLFALKHLLKSEHFRFLVAVDREGLARFLSYHYGKAMSVIEATWFLEKVFDDWVELPPPLTGEMMQSIARGSYLGDTDGGQTVRELEQAGYIALATNPRRLVRVLQRFQRVVHSNPTLEVKIDGVASSTVELVTNGFRFALCLLAVQYPDELDGLLKTGVRANEDTAYSDAFLNCLSAAQISGAMETDPGRGTQLNVALSKLPPTVSDYMQNKSSALARLMTMFLQRSTKLTGRPKVEVKVLSDVLASCLTDILPFR